MSRRSAIVLQSASYAALGVILAYLSAAPDYQYADPELAALKLSFSHATQRVEPCVRLTPEQIAELAPNMRRPEVCGRERQPLTVELDIDGKTVLHLIAPPSGLWSDGAASVYETLSLTPGQHHLAVRMRDNDNHSAWNYTYAANVQMQAGRYVTVSFKSGSFVVR